MHCIALYLHMLRIGKYERRSLEVSDKEDNHLELTSCIYTLFKRKIMHIEYGDCKSYHNDGAIVSYANDSAAGTNIHTSIPHTQLHIGVKPVVVMILGCKCRRAGDGVG